MATKTIPIEQLYHIYKVLLAGGEYTPKNADEKEAMRKAKESIAYAKEKGYQIDLPEV
jgi:hypothetical protein